MSTEEYQTHTIHFVQANNTTPPSTTNGFANTMTISLPVSVDYTNSEVALASLFCYYSWFNITAALNNNQLSYTLPNTAGTVWGATYSVFTNLTSSSTSLSDGLYSINDLNNALAFTFEYYGHYYVDSNGNNVYPITLSVNTTGYAVTVTLSQLYSNANLPSGWKYPSSALGGSPFSSTTFSMNCVASLSIPATGNAAGTDVAGQSSMSKILGFTPGSYPNQSTTPNPSTVSASQFQYNSAYPPQVGVINSVNVSCNLVNASTVSALGASVIYNFSPIVQSGQQVQERPQHLIWLPVTAGKINIISIRLQTDAFQPLPILDPGVSATLLVRKKILPSRKDTMLQQLLTTSDPKTSSSSSKRVRFADTLMGNSYSS